MTARRRQSLAALTPDIAAYEGLLAKGEFDEAFRYFQERLNSPTLMGLEPSLHRARLLQGLFPDGLDAPPPLAAARDQASVLYSLALTYNLTGGFPGLAAQFYARHDAIADDLGDAKGLAQSLGHHAKALRQAGRFRASEAVARRGLLVVRETGDLLREAVNLYWLGMGLAHRGDAQGSQTSLERAMRIFKNREAKQSEGVVAAFQAQRALWLGLYDQALAEAERACAIGAALERDDAHEDHHGAVKIYSAAMRMKGEALTQIGRVDEGEAELRNALVWARRIDFVEEELPALRALALAALQTRRFDEARVHLAATWEKARRGPFLLYHADSLNILARVERAENHAEAAIRAAREAFSRSWCDGPPFAYARGLEEATATLGDLGDQPPLLPPHNPTDFPPLPPLAIDPDP